MLILYWNVCILYWSVCILYWNVLHFDPAFLYIADSGETSSGGGGAGVIFNRRILIYYWRILISYWRMLISYWRMLILYQNSGERLRQIRGCADMLRRMWNVSDFLRFCSTFAPFYFNFASIYLDPPSILRWCRSRGAAGDGWCDFNRRFLISH